MKKVISFSLWGNIPMHCVGAIENIKLAVEVYPGWTCRFYVDDTVPKDTVNAILNENAEILMVQDKLGSFYGMFWRFFANDDPDVEVFISRDCDSRLSPKEKSAVDEWLSSDKEFHIMHDHYGHRSVPILGGMWGAKKGCINNITDKIAKWGRYDRKGIDQHFLWSLWGEVKPKCISHGTQWGNRWIESNPFPEHKPFYFGGSYVGEIFNENNKPVES